MNTAAWVLLVLLAAFFSLVAGMFIVAAAQIEKDKSSTKAVRVWTTGHMMCQGCHCVFDEKLVSGDMRTVNAPPCPVCGSSDVAGITLEKLR